MSSVVHPAGKTFPVRPATLEERDALVVLVQKIALESEGRVLDPETVRKGVYAVFDRPERGTYWVMVDPETDEIIGTTFMTVEWSDWNNGLYGWLQSVYIHPAYRGQGLLSVFFQALEAAAGEQNMVELKLYVDAQNRRAVQAYLKAGFEQDHYHLMTKRLSPP